MNRDFELNHLGRRLLTAPIVIAIVFVADCRILIGETIQADSVLIRLIDQVEVPARAIGALSEVRVTAGTIVEQGDVLAQIDDTEAVLDVRRAKFELEIAEQEAKDDVAVRSAMKSWAYANAHFDRLSKADIAQPLSVSESELGKARLDVEQAEFEVEKGKRELEKADIRKNLKSNELALAERNAEVRKILAPLSGVVVEVLHQPGEWVTPGETIFRIVSTKRVRAEGFVKADEIAKDLTGKPVRIVPNGLPGTKEFKGKVVFVSPEIDPVDGQVRVSAEVVNADGVLRPGMHADMSINTD